MPSPVNDVDLQMKLEADSVHDGLLRYAQSYEYHLATDSKPVRDLLGHSLKPLANAIRAAQLELKTSQKLPKHGIALLALNPEALGLITLGMLFNCITRWNSMKERRRAHSVSYEIGERCRTEIKGDCARNRNIDVAGELMSRNRNRHAGRRAEQLAQKRNDEDDWKANYRSFHLGEKLIALAVRFAQFEGTPLLELNTFRESASPRSASAIARSLKIRTRTTI